MLNASMRALLGGKRRTGWVHEYPCQPRVRGAEVHRMGGSVVVGCKMTWGRILQGEELHKRHAYWRDLGRVERRNEPLEQCSHSTPNKWNNAFINMPFNMHYEASGYWLPPKPTHENRPQLGLETSQNLFAQSYGACQSTAWYASLLMTHALSPRCS